MIDASKMPRVPNEVLQREKQQAVEYVRAPAASGNVPVRPQAPRRVGR